MNTTSNSKLTLTALVATALTGCGDNIQPPQIALTPDAGMFDVAPDAMEADCTNYELSEDRKLELWSETFDGLVFSGSTICYTENCAHAATLDPLSNQLYTGGPRPLFHFKMQDGQTSGFNAFATPYGAIVTYRDLLDSLNMGAIAYVSRKENCATFDLLDSWRTTINEIIFGGSTGFNSLTRPPGYDCVMNNPVYAAEAKLLADSGIGGGVTNHEVTHVEKHHGDKRMCLWEQNQLTYDFIKSQEREADVGASDGIINAQCPPAMYGTADCKFLPEGQLLVWKMISTWEGMVPETHNQTHPPSWIRYDEARARFWAYDEYHAGIEAFESVFMPTQAAYFASGKAHNQILKWCDTDNDLSCTLLPR